MLGFARKAGAPLSILGPSGAGKTMLLRCIAGLERPDRGRIVLDDRVLFDSKREFGFRRGHGASDCCFSITRCSLIARQYKTSHLALRAFAARGSGTARRWRRVGARTSQASNSAIRASFLAASSNGWRLARALAIEPEALLLDEPLSALDAHLRSQIEGQLQETFTEYRRPTLLVTHNIEEAYRLCDQLLVLSRGHIAACGRKKKFFCIRRACKWRGLRVAGISRK